MPRALAYSSGSPRHIARDNLRAGALKGHWHEPGLNPTYQDFAIHYGTAILPTRPHDKAKVEIGVQVVERWILARLRDQRLFGLPELNTATRTLLADLNGRPLRRRGVSSTGPALAALPD